MNYKKFTKQQLINFLEIYETQIDILDLMLSDMNNVTNNDVDIWLKTTQNLLEKEVEIVPKFDKEHYKQITIEEALEEV